MVHVESFTVHLVANMYVCIYSQFPRVYRSEGKGEMINKYSSLDEYYKTMLTQLITKTHHSLSTYIHHVLHCHCVHRCRGCSCTLTIHTTHIFITIHSEPFISYSMLCSAVHLWGEDSDQTISRFIAQAQDPSSGDPTGQFTPEADSWETVDCVRKQVCSLAFCI